MKLRPTLRHALPLLLATVCVSAPAQQLIGYVPTRDADITGSTDDLDGRAVLTGSASVTAKDHTAPITLGRGGTVNVCQTSVLHVTENRSVSVNAPLLFSLDRGAIEVHMNGTPTDAIMTPDLRFTVRTIGPLDLSLRVARNGDTCVESRGATAPTLAVTDAFGTEMYELNAGQHVLFEHGSVRDVVDSETSPCGCPDPKGLSLADAMLVKPAAAAPKTGPKTETPPVAAASIPTPHPFPTAISEGLAPTEELGPVPPAQAPQLTDSLVYNGLTKDPDALPPQDQVSTAPSFRQCLHPRRRRFLHRRFRPLSLPHRYRHRPAPAPTRAPEPAQPEVTPAPPPHNRDLAHAVGHFFRKLFGGH